MVPKTAHTSLLYKHVPSPFSMLRHVPSPIPRQQIKAVPSPLCKFQWCARYPPLCLLPIIQSNLRFRDRINVENMHRKNLAPLESQVSKGIWSLSKNGDMPLPIQRSGSSRPLPVNKHRRGLMSSSIAHCSNTYVQYSIGVVFCDNNPQKQASILRCSNSEASQSATRLESK